MMTIYFIVIFCVFVIRFCIARKRMTYLNFINIFNSNFSVTIDNISISVKKSNKTDLSVNRVN